MDFVPACPPAGDGSSLQPAAPGAANGFLPENPGRNQEQRRSKTKFSRPSLMQGVTTDMTLPRRSRLSGQTAFSRVFQQAVVSTDASFKILGRCSGQAQSRLGMAVSRQVDKRAVARNRLKRIVRQSFREHYLGGNRHLSLDIVVLPRRQAVSESNKQLFEDLSRHWRRIDERISKAPPKKRS